MELQAVPQVKIKLYGVFREIAGEKVLSVNINKGTTLGDLIKKICGEIGDEFKAALLDPVTNAPRQYINLLINGRHNRFLGGLDAVLDEGDVIDILMPAIGG